MSELLNLSIYNPSSLSDDDFLRSFVARREVASTLIERLAQSAAGPRGNHQLILGQRGMGKTSMLRRLALAATNDPRLARTLIPLSFREEQYNVHSLYVFWTNCLDALGDWFERSGQPQKADQLDRDVAVLSGEPGESLALFNKWIAKEKRRPLLLLDNIDLILAGLKKELPAFREYVEGAGDVVIVGGSATEVDAICDADGAFHDFFEVTRLSRLTKEELIACLRSLALARGADGERVLQVVNKDAARIRTLHDLTGGNPRTLTLIYMLLERDSSGDVFSDLERLLDQVTVLYKARVEDLPAQARVVLDAVALEWNPILAAQVASVTLLDVTVVSSQLDRLQKEGVIEKVAVSKTTKAAYQISERFFNIWYLMRHGQRRQRSRLRWLTVFLRSFYTHDQLVERAKYLLNSNAEFGAEVAQLLLALSDAIDDEAWRSGLKNQARDEFEKYAQSLGLSLNEIVDPSDVPRPQSAHEWNQYANLLRRHLVRPKEAEGAYLAATEQDPHHFPAWFNLGMLRMAELADPAGAASALRKAVESKPDDLRSHYFLGNALAQAGLNEEAKEVYRTCLRLNNRFYLAAIALGDLLTDEGRLADAQYQYRLAATLAPRSDTQALHAGAFFAAYILEEFDRAVRLYKRLLKIDPQDFVALSNLAVLRCFSDQVPLQLDVDRELIERHSTYGQALIRVLQAMRSGDRATALSQMSAVFQGTEEQIFEDYRGFVLLLLREAERQKWGDLILRLLDETGASDRHWPLRAAYEAYLYGTARLLDVNPEVRVAATKIHGLLVAPATYREGLLKEETPARLKLGLP